MVIGSMTRDMEVARQKIEVVNQEKQLLREELALARRRLEERDQEAYAGKEQALQLRGALQDRQLEIERLKLGQSQLAHQ
jgi:hypothetical protein